jgi:hypothetical protein
VLLQENSKLRNFFEILKIKKEFNTFSDNLLNFLLLDEVIIKNILKLAKKLKMLEKQRKPYFFFE